MSLVEARPSQVKPLQFSNGREVEAHARDVRARKRASYGPGTQIIDLQFQLSSLRGELENTKCERDMYRALCDELKRQAEAQKPAEQEIAAVGVKLCVKGIIDIVSAAFGVDPADVISAQRHQEVTEPRHVAIYLARRVMHLQWIHIGRKLGGRDHSTCAHAFSKIETRVQNEPAFAARVQELEDRLIAIHNAV